MRIKMQFIGIVAAFLVGIVGCSTDRDNNANNEVGFGVGSVEDEIIDIKENIQEFTVEKDKITIHFELYNVGQEKQDDGTTRFSVEGYSGSYDENTLPFLSYVLALPQDTALKDVNTPSWSDTVHTMDNIKLTNLGLSHVQGEEGTGVFESTSDDGFKMNVFVQKYQGIPVVYISIFPIIYNEESQQVRFVESGDFQLNLKEEIWDMSHYKSPERVKNVVDNPEIVDSYKVSEN